MELGWSDPRSLLPAAARRGLDPGFERLFAHLAENGPSKVPTRGEAAELTDLGASTFTRHFRMMAGRSWTRHTLAWRMENAKVWLERQFSSLKEVRQACGYGSTRAFARAYRKYFSEPPRKWHAGDGADR
jgi:transcriptional regulator GlxA family with amidase domain